jgi:hypothetical protein
VSLKNLHDSSSGPKKIDSNSMKREVVLSAILSMHINASSGVKRNVAVLSCAYHFKT